MRSISCGRSVGGADWASWFGGCGAAAVAGGSVMISNSLMIMGIGLLPCDIHPGTKAATGTDASPSAHSGAGPEPGPGPHAHVQVQQRSGTQAQWIVNVIGGGNGLPIATIAVASRHALHAVARTGRCQRRHAWGATAGPRTRCATSCLPRFTK